MTKKQFVKRVEDIIPNSEWPIDIDSDVEYKLGLKQETFDIVMHWDEGLGGRYLLVNKDEVHYIYYHFMDVSSDNPYTENLSFKTKEFILLGEAIKEYYGTH